MQICQIVTAVILVFAFSACSQSNTQVLYDITFDKEADLLFFVEETESPEEGQLTIKNNALDIDAVKGASIWFKDKITAPVKIEYTVVVVDEGGPNDRVSDLNCFFMAIDPRCPDDIFSCPDSVRTGKFGTYHALRTYYVGYGGNSNSTTRFRRYPGYTEERPLLPEHDLAEPFLLKPNERMKIEIKIEGNKVSYGVDGKTLFQLDDDLPYHEGWFAFRTVRNHMKIYDFKVSSLR